MPKLNFTLDLLATRSFERLSAVLRDRNETIMQRWHDAVRDVLPDADKLTMEQLRNSLPEIMEQIAQALESDRPEHVLELIELTKPHGAARFQQQYDIREMVAEYRMWRRILIEEVWRGADSPLNEEEITALNMAIDTALEGGVLAFTDHQTRQIREAADVEARYLAFLSHDMRNHINHAALLIQLISKQLRAGADMQGLAEKLDAARTLFAQTIRGMERLLEAERLRKHAIEPKRDKVDLQSLATEAAGEFAQEARTKGLSLEIEIPPATEVYSDAELLSLILQNLIGNAVKYSDRGVVRISASRNPKEHAWTLSVQDQGPGIPAEQVDRLFGAFTRGETHGQKGTGLGLSIVSTAAKVLRAEIAVDSEPGKGANFRLKLQDWPAKR